MLVKNRDRAQVQIVLVSDNRTQADNIYHDLLHSEVEYYFVCLLRPANLIFHAQRNFIDLVSETPTIFIFDYKFCERYVDDICMGVNLLSQSLPVEYVLIDVPAGKVVREEFIRAGATLFDSEYEEGKKRILIN